MNLPDKKESMHNNAGDKASDANVTITIGRCRKCKCKYTRLDYCVCPKCNASDTFQINVNEVKRLGEVRKIPSI